MGRAERAVKVTEHLFEGKEERRSQLEERRGLRRDVQNSLVSSSSQQNQQVEESSDRDLLPRSRRSLSELLDSVEEDLVESDWCGVDRP